MVRGVPNIRESILASATKSIGYGIRFAKPGRYHPPVSARTITAMTKNLRQAIAATIRTTKKDVKTSPMSLGGETPNTIANGFPDDAERGASWGESEREV